jgi:hypothetical protein
MEEKGKPSAPPRAHDEILKEAEVMTYTAVEAIELMFGKAAAEQFKEEMAQPNAAGWLRLWEVLHEARNDKQIAASPGASEFLELVNDLAIDALYAQSADEAVRPLIEIIQSSLQRAVANKRHDPSTKAKAWIVSEWKREKEGYKGNKSDFARHYARRITNEMDGLNVKERTIRERWLKGL